MRVSAPTLELPRREGREGGKWVNHKPVAEEVAEWFLTSVQLHPGMRHEDWLGGLTLIQTTERSDVVLGLDEHNLPVIQRDVQNVFFAPYMRVDTRVAYFLAWCDMENLDPKIEAVYFKKDDEALPPGFTVQEVRKPDGTSAPLITCTKRAAATHPRGHVILEADGSKSVPWLDRYGQVDADALAKAETGAVGRALGFLGMLTIPGTGVATFEDMQEMLSRGQVPSVAPPSLPSEEPPHTGERGKPLDANADDEQMRTAATEKIDLLQDAYPEALKTFQAWARERNLPALNVVSGAALKGVLRKLDATIEEAQEVQK